MALILLLGSSCRHTSSPEYPLNSRFVVDTENGFCYEFVLIDADKMLYDFSKEHPLEKCDKIIGYTGGGISALILYIEDLRKKADRRCE